MAPTEPPAYTPTQDSSKPEDGDGDGDGIDSSASTKQPAALTIEEDGFRTQMSVGDDGRMDINISKQDARIANELGQARLNAAARAEQEAALSPPLYDEPTSRALGVPPLNIVIQIVGSRGDVQPFVALGQVLKNRYGHRVRLATHGVFKGFVEENGLEFFDIGGDPAALMAFMVKNPGLIPSMKSVKEGEVSKRRKAMAEIVEGCWKSCLDIDEANKSQDGSLTAPPFIAQAIIANPPSLAHIHCAEKLGIPLHLMFTMPWSPTRDFPQPLANIKSKDTSGSTANESSYTIVEMMIWQGLGTIVNRFRRETLGLPELSQSAAVTMVERLRVPYTYCWSPALIPKPKDWGKHIDIAGFYFLPLATNYQPPSDLAKFLADGPPPVYIGFGSIVVDDPNAMTKLIFEAVRLSGQRALVSKGWGGIGGDELDKPEEVFMLGNCPHDWLFQHVSCVVHHGGAGTTAAGIALGRPTIIVPFFGDQPFWGAMVARAGAGPEPIPYKALTAEGLSSAILEAIKPETSERARELGSRIGEEKGSETGATSFHNHLEMDRMRCFAAPSRPAVWRVKTVVKGEDILLSSFAATLLGKEGMLDINHLKVHRPHEWVAEELWMEANISEANPVLSTAGAIAANLLLWPVDLVKSLGGVVQEPYRGGKKAGWRGFGKGLKSGLGAVIFPRRGSSLGYSSYGFRVLYERLKKKMDSDTLSFILAARFAEGFEQVKASSEAERSAVIKRWRDLAPRLKGAKDRT